MDGLIDITQLGVTLTPLPSFATDGGEVRRILRNNEETYSGFGEVYMTTITKGVVRGWKRHTKYSCNLVPILGAVQFIFANLTTGQITRAIELSTKNYARLFIPSGIWFVFRGINEDNYILNILNQIHSSDEVERKNIEDSSLKINWDAEVYSARVHSSV